MSHPRLRALVVASLILSAGCQRQADPPVDAPAGMAVAAGDGLALVSWVQDPNLTYWIFYQAASSVTPAAPGVPIIRTAQSPRVIANLANGTQYAFVMNATNADSPAGPSTPVMTAIPRLAGASWTVGTPLGTTPQDLNGIAFNGSRFVAVGNAGSIFAGDYSYTNPSPPGVTAWTPVVSVWWASQLTGVVPNLSAAIFNGARFVALSADGSILESPDGLTWTSAGAVPAGGASMNGIALGSVSGVAVYVAVGSGGKIFASSDLVNWTDVSNIAVTIKDLFAVAFLNGSFVATGANGTLVTSPDGSNWTAQVSNTANALRGAAFGATATMPASYVAVGDAGTVVTSADAVTWTAITLPLAPNLRSVTFGSRFLAVGQGGAVAYSDDAINWSATGAGSNDLNRVIFTPGMYVAVGAGGANAVAK